MSKVDDDKPLEIELRSSDEVCAGMVAAYVCRSIAHRAGTYAPGIHERVFSSLAERHFGSDIDSVASWFRRASTELNELGYRLCARRVAFRTPMIKKWVAGGDGYRAALLTTDGRRLHDGKIISEGNPHAVGLLVPNPALKKKGLELVDPWPGVQHKRPAEPLIDNAIEPAHRQRKYGTVLVFWAGYS